MRQERQEEFRITSLGQKERRKEPNNDDIIFHSSCGFNYISVEANVFSNVSRIMSSNILQVYKNYKINVFCRMIVLKQSLVELVPLGRVGPLCAQYVNLMLKAW